MFGNKKGFSAHQSRRTSRRMSSSMIGTHNARRPTMRTSRAQSDNVGFSSSRRSRRAERGIVDGIIPQTKTRESLSAHSQRMGRHEFAVELQRKARIKRIAIIAAIIVALAVAGCAAAIAAYFGSVSSSMALKDSNASSALVAPKENAPYYALLAADLDTPTGEDGVFSADALVVARIDEKGRALSLLSVPANVRTTLSDGKSHYLSEANALGGDAELIDAVEAVVGISVAHYAKTDAASLVSLVDALGGVSVNVTEEVDDPNAGSSYIAAGQQVLSGEEALTFLRATNFRGETQTQAANQLSLLSAISARILSEDTPGFLVVLDSLASCVQTDLSSNGAKALASALRGLAASDISSGRLPGYETKSGDTPYYAVDSAGTAEVVARMDEGSAPVLADASATGSVDKQSFEITVRNGSGITGGASQVKAVLEQAGFTVAETGNADSYVYNETLVIYKDKAQSQAASAVVDALGVGRSVYSLSYEFDTEILVVLGKDWMPVS